MSAEGPLVDLDYGDTSTDRTTKAEVNGSTGVPLSNESPSVRALVDRVNQLSITPSSPPPAVAPSSEDRATQQRKATANGRILSLQDAIVNSHQNATSSHLLAFDVTTVDGSKRSGNGSLLSASTSTVATTTTNPSVDVEGDRDLAVPDVSFEGITLDSGIDRESQPLLGSRDHEITYNQFPGKFPAYNR